MRCAKAATCWSRSAKPRAATAPTACTSAARLATLLAPALPHAGGLIATGGETARAVLSTAGIDALRLCDEIESGMPLLHAQLTGVDRVLPVVTKAGGFGTPGSLHAAWRRLIETAASPHPKELTQ